MLEHVTRLAVDEERSGRVRKQLRAGLAHDRVRLAAPRARLQQLGHPGQRLTVAMKRFEFPDRGGERLVVATHGGVGLAARGNFTRQITICFPDCRQPGFERRMRGAQGLFRAMQRGDVTRDGDLADQVALSVQQRRGLERDADDLAALLAPLGGRRRWNSGAYAFLDAGVVGVGEVGRMKLAERLPEGFLR